MGSSGHQLDVLVELALRDLRLRYRGSVLGLAWSQVAPLAQLTVMTVVSTKVVPIDVEHYPAFLLIGLLAWQWCSGGVAAGTNSIFSGRDLLRRPSFPGELLPPVALVAQGLVFALGLPVALVLVIIETGRLPVTVVAVPVIAAVQVLILAGPVWFLAAANVRYRDVAHVVSLAMVPLFYATPVLYSTDHVPGSLRTVLQLNPMAHLLEAYRDAALGGHWPAPLPMLVLIAVGGVLAIAGRAACRRAVPVLVDEL
jgi:ABC-type polysaccharide/polyol phosphate export permease